MFCQVNYVSAHDNESLFDIIMLKCAPEVSLEERCRINHVATSIVALAQGIPFFHAGDDMLRSKSLDRDSYNSGDWFNRLDFSYETNNWAVGLPPKNKNGFKWSIMRELLGDPSLKPTKTHILAAVENFKELLRIRFSSPLFRLTTANAIQARLRFHNTGPGSIPGVIIYSIEDGTEGKPGLMQLDFKYRFHTQTLPVNVQDSRKLLIHVQKTYTPIWAPISGLESSNLLWFKMETFMQNSCCNLLLWVAKICSKELLQRKKVCISLHESKKSANVHV
jgi:hypothetical protein